jgi:Ca2+-binding RTX toxin-like protein
MFKGQRERGTSRRGAVGKRRDRRHALLLGVGVILAIAMVVGATVAAQTIYGGGGGEVINGTSSADAIYGGDGDDLIHGLGGDDQVFGQGGNDDVYGDDGADTVTGGAGDDKVFGGAGDDTLTGGPGFDEIYGEAGNDVIRADDGTPDMVDCGPGDDTAYVDRNEDGVYDCEHLITPPSTPAGGV